MTEKERVLARRARALLASNVAGYPISLGIGALVAVIGHQIAHALKVGGFWLTVSTIAVGLIGVGAAFVAVQVWLYPWVATRAMRDPLKQLADEADDLANRINATRDRLVDDMESGDANPRPALREFESELGVPLHNMYHRLVARQLLTVGDYPTFYKHDNFETWQLAIDRLRQAASNARVRAYGTHV